MPKFFKSKPKPPDGPAYVAPAGAITVTRKHFDRILRSQLPSFREYEREVGQALATQAANDIHTQNLKCMTAAGYWSSVESSGPYGASDLRFADDASLSTFVNGVDAYLDMDIKKINERRAYCRGLKAEAAAGQLYAKLQNLALNDQTYYASWKPATARPQSPQSQPPQNDYRKALAWLKFDLRDGTVAFEKEFQKYAKYDGSNPLGGDLTMLQSVWRATVTTDKKYRGWNSAAVAGHKYPSDIGGTHVLTQVILDLSVNTVLPQRGDTLWYDYGLYVLGAVLTCQSFTDGNKRMARFAYGLMLLSGGVPFIAPNVFLGGQLADMK